MVNILKFLTAYQEEMKSRDDKKPQTEEMEIMLKKVIDDASSSQISVLREMIQQGLKYEIERGELHAIVSRVVQETIQEELKGIIDIRLPQIIKEELNGSLNTEMPPIIKTELGEGLQEELPTIIKREVSGGLNAELSKIIKEEVKVSLDLDMSRAITEEIVDGLDAKLKRIIKKELHSSLDMGLSSIVQKEIEMSLASEQIEKVTDGTEEAIQEKKRIGTEGISDINSLQESYNPNNSANTDTLCVIDNDKERENARRIKEEKQENIDFW